MYICICNAITESQIRACAEREGACSLVDLERCLGIGSGCGRCKHAAREVLSEKRSDTLVVLASTSP
jgi:bacterioferritin-associated ferredoxin